MNLISLSDLSPTDIRNIWRLVGEPVEPLNGTVVWSFEGNGIRTRTTFIQAFRDLDLQFTELPNLLKTGERARDLAGYLMLSTTSMSCGSPTTQGWLSLQPHRAGRSSMPCRAMAIRARCSPMPTTSTPL